MSKLRPLVSVCPQSKSGVSATRRQLCQSLLAGAALVGPGLLPLHEVLDPNLTRVDARVNYSAMTSWRPWMHMGDIPGQTASNGFGARARSVEDLPDDFLRYTRELHPDVLQDPEAVLDTFEG